MSVAMSNPLQEEDIPLGNKTPPKIEPKYVVNAGPRSDRETFIQNYTGNARFERQLYIGLHSKTHGTEYLLGAFDDAQNGQNPHQYILARQACIHFGLLQGPGGHDAWLNDCEKRNNVQRTELELDLSKYKKAQVKETMRMGFEDLANFHLSTGEYSKAADDYKKLRHLAETEAHVLAVNMGLVSVNLAEKAWTNALTSALRLHGISGSSQLSPEERSSGMKLYGLACGISHLSLAHDNVGADDRFLRAAASFLVIPAGLGSSFNHTLSPNDVALYGGICALATMPRDALQKDALDSSSFRTYLELEPQMRKAISHFINGKYSACLAIIEGYRNDFLLDPYLGGNTERLLGKIRDRCIVNYCYPFSVVKLSTLASQFAKPGQDIISTLVDLIKRGLLNARLDVMAGTLNTVLTSPRTEIQRQTLQSVQDYQRELKRRILHMSITKADLEVKPKKSGSEWGESGRSARGGGGRDQGGYSGGGHLGQLMLDNFESSDDEALGGDDMMED